MTAMGAELTSCGSTQWTPADCQQLALTTKVFVDLGGEQRSRLRKLSFTEDACIDGRQGAGHAYSTVLQLFVPLIYAYTEPSTNFDFHVAMQNVHLYPDKKTTMTVTVYAPLGGIQARCF
jgi:hypothetical protein